MIDGDNQTYKKGFTIVELLVVIVVIAILATITIMAYTGIQQRARVAAMSSDLNSVQNIFGLWNVDYSNYPTDISTTTVKASNNIVLQSATSNTGFCVNAYSKTDPTLRMSWNSTGRGIQDGLCNGATIGSPVGGTVPLAARGINLLPGFSRWTLSGGATYNSSTNELLLGNTGYAVSPLIRVDQPSGINVGGDFYATTASPYSSYVPNGGYHTGSSYYASDGITPVANSVGNMGNGCAMSITLSIWDLADTRCAYSGGPLIIYLKISFTGTNGGYSSPDLKIRNPLLIIN